MADLGRFLDAQASGVYETALAELRAGDKRSHWMWFVFPQIAGLGHSETARKYAITGHEEAGCYLAHEALGNRLRDCTEAMLEWAERRSAERILGPVDAMKLKSSLTLFDAVHPGDVFGRALEELFGGTRDKSTLGRL